jgi:hypothetical protein
MLTCFFDIAGIIHYEFIPPKQPSYVTFMAAHSSRSTKSAGQMDFAS